MGQTLSAPITEKHSYSGHNARFAFGASSMQGWRPTMEDAHTTLLELSETNDTAFFAVYDGHGGSNISKFCSQHLHEYIMSDPSFSKGEYKKAISNGFLEMDVKLGEDPELGANTSGCTAITATITNSNILYVGNAGDSRGVLCRSGKHIPMSVDHKPTNTEESTRIFVAGGSVESGRVNGLAGMSRALGDLDYKSNEFLKPEEQLIIPHPDVKEHQLTGDDEFLVLACDGIWECMSSQSVIKFVRTEISIGSSLVKVCEKLMDHCLAEKDKFTTLGRDNMTVIIIAFLNGRTEKEWYDGIRGRRG